MENLQDGRSGSACTERVSIEIKKRDFVAIIGASGSGKSTLMNLIGCLDIPSRGRIYLKSQDISKLSESDLASLRGNTIGFIFQQYNLIQSMTAFENVKLPLEFLEYDDQEATNRAREILTLIGLKDQMHHHPTQLSGGQNRRELWIVSLEEKFWKCFMDKFFRAIFPVLSLINNMRKIKLNEKKTADFIYRADRFIFIALLVLLPILIFALSNANIQTDSVDYYSISSSLALIALLLIRVPVMYDCIGQNSIDIGGVPVFCPHTMDDALMLIRSDLNRYVTILAPFAILGLQNFFIISEGAFKRKFFV